MKDDAVKKPVVITELADLDKHAGEVVTVRGTLNYGKEHRVLGVFVYQQDEAPLTKLHGKTVEVTGKLVKYVHDNSRDRLTQRPSGTYFKIDLSRGAEGVVKEVK
ncbi:MAG: hypothetical protein AB8C95_14765 [Phycisphaeraceae bacterium]